MSMTRVAVAVTAFMLASQAHAEDAPPLCSERPGLTTNECVIKPGHVQIETALGDWTLERAPGARTDTVLIGDSQLRVGVGGGLELRLGWTPFGHVRDRQDGQVDAHDGVGDVTIGLKQNLIDAQKHGDVGLSLAVIPFATLPVGRYPVGAGDWSAGMRAPVGYRVSKDLKFEFTSLVQAAVDADGHGRHLLYSGATGAKVDVSKAISIQAEVELLRDDDPDRDKRGTQALAGLSTGVQLNDRLQLDLGTNIGLNRRAPDAEVYAGVTRLF